MEKFTQEIQFGKHTLILETGEIARQAHGSVMVQMGDTQLLVTVVGEKKPAEERDFFPLTVNYQEKFAAAGKIPGGFNKREGRPSEQETLISRLIDRPLRPLFPEGFRQEVQIIVTCLSLDKTVQPDIPAIIGASAALGLSGIPFNGPIAAARVGYSNGVYTLNAGYDERSELDLVVAGTESAILMVESEARELSEAIMLGAVLFGQEMYKPVIAGIKALCAKAAKPAWVWQAPEKDEKLHAQVEALALDALKKAYSLSDKISRYEAIDEVKKELIQSMLNEDPATDVKAVEKAFNAMESHFVRQSILDGFARIDGRDRKTVRPIAIRTGCLVRPHGSVLFTRGETQALVTVTLGNENSAQILDSLAGETRDRFMLHYNFPPYSVGEMGMVGSPKRREIGHGRLAKRSLMAVLPDSTEFPYVLRVVSEITESNGSSSMATVCGTSLALMDAGVPLKSPVAGVAMGLIKEGDQFAVLTDILGDEDHLGDMDFKVAGTEKGVTALQMDIKISGITKEIMEQALEQALAGRLHILEKMRHALPEHREELSLHAPRITTFKVPEDKVRTVIGKGGATIKGLIESTGVSIDIDDTGRVQLFSPDALALEEAQRQIKLLVADIEVGQTYAGKVSKIVDFGAFINLLPGKDGLLHISQICNDRNQKVETVLTEGQEIEVFVAGVDKQGRVKLEWKGKPPAISSSAADTAVTESITPDEEIVSEGQDQKDAEA